VIIVETLDGAGAVRSRAKLTAFPATVGRAFASDLIIDDPYVCPRHLDISEDDTGALVALDVCSVNGLWSEGRRVPRVEIGASTELWIGRTRLRFRSPDEMVAPALTDIAPGAAANRASAHREMPAALSTLLQGRSPRAVATGVVIVAIAVLAASTYFGSTERNGASSAVGAALGIGAACAVWAGCWALATRIVSHRFNFLAHLVLALAALTLVTLVGAAGGWLDFLVPAAPLGAIVNALGAAAIAGALFYGHLTALGSVSHAARLRAVAGAAALVIVAIGATALTDDSDDEFTDELDYKSQLRPAAGLIVHTVSPDEFAELAESLRRTVDSLAVTEDSSREGGPRPVEPGRPEPRPRRPPPAAMQEGER